MSRAARRLAVTFVVVGAISSAPIYAQINAQAEGFIESSLKSLSNSEIQDISLSVVARRIAGSTDETGDATFSALKAGSTQMVYQGTASPTSETRVWSANAVRSGVWVDAQGTRHPFSYHNMMSEPSWFFPAFALQRASDATYASTSYIGAETFNGVTVQHLRVIALNQLAADNTQSIQTLSQTELYLDAGTLLPVALTFNDHPDNNMDVSIPVKVVYSQYQPMDGTTLPTHIQQFRNGSLALDLQVQSAKVNSGLTISALSAQ